MSTTKVRQEAKVQTAKERIIAVWRSHNPEKNAKLIEDMNRSPNDFIPALLELIDLKALRQRPHPTVGIQIRSLSHLIDDCGKQGRDAAIPLLIRMGKERDQIREQRPRRPASEWGTPYVASDKEKVRGLYDAIISRFSNGILGAFGRAKDPAIRVLLVARLPNVPWSEQSHILEYLHAVVPNDEEVREVVRKIRDDPKSELHRVRTNRERVNREWNLDP